MRIRVLDDRPAIGRAAAREVTDILAAAIAARGHARLVAATGTSQLPLLAALLAARDASGGGETAGPGAAALLDWSRVELFHLDEYLGLPTTHEASFARFVLDRIVRPLGIRACHLLDGMAEPSRVMAEIGAALQSAPIDLVLAGIGENGHLAFNDPPADLETDEPWLVVTLDEACRRQQVGEGWFPTVEAVPAQALTMSVPQILRGSHIVCLAPDARKAAAVRACFSDGVTPQAPASALLRHPAATVYLDRASAAGLSPDVLERLGAHPA